MNNFNRNVSQLKTTTNYSLFKHAKWNRPLCENHVNELIESIKKRGVLEAHKVITLTKDYEVFDGQHRLEAFKRLRLPITYIIDYEATIEDCGVLNSSVKKWDVETYVNAYIEDKRSNSDSYLLIRNLSRKYPYINMMTIAIISTNQKDLADTNYNKCVLDSVKNGSFERKESLTNIERELVFISECLVEIGKKVDMIVRSRSKGPKGCQYWVNALHYLFLSDDIDKERFFSKLKAKQSSLLLPANTEQALEQFEKIYNDHLKIEEKLDIVHNYKQKVRLKAVNNLKKRRNRN